MTEKPAYLTETDEVWLALEQALGSLRRDGHKPNEDRLACWNCYLMFLVENAMEVYRRRHESLPRA